MTSGPVSALTAPVHFVGVGGAGMSAMAIVLREAGQAVSGSDQRDSAVLDELRRLGVTTYAGHWAQQVAGAATVVVSAAVPPTNPEVAAARAAGVPVVARGEALARMVAGCRTVAVSGTHGKTTTSGMVAGVASTAGLDPTWVIGAAVAGLGPGGHRGGGTVCVVEADEAYGSFLALAPAIAVVTNVEQDHLDHYGTIEALRQAFEQFIGSATEAAVLCSDDLGARRLARVAAAGGRRLVTYGLAPAAPAETSGHVSARELVPGARASSFVLTLDGVGIAQVTLRVAGRHNVQNALGAAAGASVLGVEPEAIARGLGAFGGAARRFEARGSVAGVDLVDDYAHHPTEVAATLETARSGPWRRVIAVFQPHLYSRTQSMAAEFGRALAAADMVVVTEVYGAREEPVPGVTGQLVADAVAAAGRGSVEFVPSLEGAALLVRGVAREGDLILSLGAGDVTTFPDLLLAGWRA